MFNDATFDFVLAILFLYIKGFTYTFRVNMAYFCMFKGLLSRKGYGTKVKPV